MCFLDHVVNSLGHQAIAVALGGKLEKSAAGYNVGIQETQFHTKRPWMTPEHDNLPMYVFHEDQVTELPEGCELIGSSTDCPIASFAKGEHIFTTQAHPEFSHEFMSQVLRFTEDKMNSDSVKNAWASLNNDQLGHVFGTWSTNFFKGNRV